MFCNPNILKAHVAQLVERILGKDEVIGSIPIVGSIISGNLTGEDIRLSCLCYQVFR